MWLCKGLQFLNVKLSLKQKDFQKPIWIPNTKLSKIAIFFCIYIYIFFFFRELAQSPSQKFQGSSIAQQV